MRISNLVRFTRFGVHALACLVAGLSLSAMLASGGEKPEAKPASPATNTTAPARATMADLFGDPVIARGQGVEVKRSQLEDAFTAWKANLAARGQSISEDQRTFR